jgi:uncharacterized protein YprB with RNaseH-like and TPR domain
MDDKTRLRLRRLGVVKGARNLESPALKGDAAAVDRPLPRPSVARDLEPAGQLLPLTTLIPGMELVETDVGVCAVVDKMYPLSYLHGDSRLESLLHQSLASSVTFFPETRLTKLGARQLLFLDTETTGLAGAGAIAFMVGAAFFEQGASGDLFVVRQYFLRDHGDETAMLTLLAELVRSRSGLVTFNGKSFDIPLLENRYLMNRLVSPLSGLPHIDLLPSSRRLWRNRLGSCALSHLEPTLLAVRRTQEDVPGWQIPGLYHDYLRSGDGRELQRVFYHNEIDMLSMVTLLSKTMELLTAPGEEHDPVDLMSLGKWQQDLGQVESAETTLRMALSADPPLTFYHQTLQRLGLLLKRSDRREEAVPLWQQMAATSFEDVSAHIELAKHFEWQLRETEAAIGWTQQALQLLNNAPAGERTRRLRAELEHRLSRLQRKSSTPA